MRSTIKISSNLALDNILDNYARVIKLQNQMGKGRRVINPSDDPLATNAGMRLDTLLSRIDQYNRNTQVGNSFLSLSDASLGSVNELLNTAKSLTIGAASETTTHEMRRTNAVEMNNLLKELVSVGNRKDGTRFIFGGTETQQSPFEIVASRYVHYRGNEKQIEIQADNANYVPMNITGEQAFGSMETVLKTRDVSPDVNMAVDMSTRLEDLNLGDGVASGSINIQYSSHPTMGLEVDLSSADTLEDVKDLIERLTLEGSQALDPAGPLGNDVRDRYVAVEINPDHNGIRLYEVDGGTEGASAPGATGNSFTVREVGGNTVAQDLGVLGSSSTHLTLGETLIGGDVDPILTENTLLADLEGFDDAVYTIKNGAPDGEVKIQEFNDANNLLDNWSLFGLTKGVNTGEDGELYTRVSHPAAGQWQVDIYRVPLDQAQSSDLIATGSRTSPGGSILLQQANDSGVSGTVSLNFPIGDPVGTEYDIDMLSIYDTPFEAVINVPAFKESGDTSNVADGWHVRGLEKGVSVDADDKFYVDVQDLGGGVINVGLFNDAAMGAGDLIASGQLRGGVTEGTVRLVGNAANGFEEIDGTVHIEWPGGGPYQFDVEATFATVKDFINEVKRSNTYTSARIAENGKSLEIIGHLAGAYLTVEEAGTSFEQLGDENESLSQLHLNGIARRENTDAAGNLYAEVLDLGAAAAPDRYQVNLYSDRTRQALVATGTRATATGLVTLSEANGSGLNGSVQIDYTVDDSDIIVYPGGMRVAGDEDTQISQLNIPGIIPGVNADYEGNLYATIIDDTAGSGNYEVHLYKSASRTASSEVAVGSINAVAGLVTNWTEVNSSGLGAAGSGTSLYLDYVQDDSDIVIRPGSLRMNGQEREQNIFATFNDVIDGMHANDAEALHNLLGDFKTDLDRVLLARAEVGSRQDRLDLVEERHEDEKINFGKVRADRIDLDFAEAIVQFQAHQNVFEASLRTTAQIIPLSLVDFI